MKTMKIMKRLMGCAAAILALTACSESEDLLAAYHSDSKAVHITAQVGKASADGFTRSNPLGDAKKQTEFNENDEISVQADGQSAVTYQFNGSEWLPKESSKFLKWEKETMNFTAYYPASFNGTINQPEKYNSEDDLAAADFMSFSGSRTNDKDNNNQLTLTMERQMARVVVEIAGFNDQYTTNATVNSLSICGVKAYKQDKKFYALIKPCDAQNSETFISLDVAEGEGESKTTTEKLTGIPALAAGNSYTYKLTVGKNKISVSGITVADWTTSKTIIEGKAEEYIPYVTFKANGEQKFKMITYGDFTFSNLEYSVNGVDWKTVVAGDEGVVTFGSDKGDLRLRGKNPNGTATDYSNYSTIKFTENAPVACTGDIRTLLDWSNYNTVDTQNAKFCYLFSCCSVLTSAPKLPAETLADNCYGSMFNRCTNLTSAPALPATTLAIGCYSRMFEFCTNLESAPVLSAETLAQNCYYSMFYGCSKLTTVTMLAPSTEISKEPYSSLSFFLNWLYEAGNDASVTTRTLKVQDAAAYTALEGTGDLPDIWKKGAANTTVLNKDGGEIK